MLSPLRQGRLRSTRRKSAQPGKIHLHLAISAGCFLLALAGWGSVAHLSIASKESEAQLRREISRLAVERNELSERQNAASADRDASKADLALARRAITGFMKALEDSRAELSATTEQLELIRQQQSARR